MQRRHFEALAKALKSTQPIHGDLDYASRHGQWRKDVYATLNAVREFNPQFDGERFLKACGFTDV